MKQKHQTGLPLSKGPSHVASFLLLAGFVGIFVVAGYVIRLSSRAGVNNSATTLDASGATIPDTNYTIPSGAIFMATNGSDTNAGTQAAPVLTINKAVSLVPAGGTIVVRGGTYRDWYNSNGSFANLAKQVTIQAYPHESPWFDGADVKPSNLWTSDGAGHWYMDWNTPQFCSNNYYAFHYENQNANDSGPCTHYDMYLLADKTTKTPKGDPQMVFVNGVNMIEVDTLAAATGGAFYYDWTNKRMYISSNPATSTIELSARPSAMILAGANSKILGIGFKRYATNEYNNSTEAAVIMSSTGQTAENSVFTLNAGAGLGLSNPVNDYVNHNVFAYNGFDGAEGNGHQHSTGAADNPMIENNVFNHNNTEDFGLGCSASCSQAGIKISHMVGFTFRNNIVTDNVGAHGFWCDLACSNGTIVNNYVRGNGKSGIMYEVSDTGIIASNLVVDNVVGIRVAAANTKIYNNTVVNNKSEREIWVYDDDRSFGVGGWTDVGPDTLNVSMANNIVESNAGIIIRGEGKTTTQTSPATPGYFAYVDYNAYQRVNTTGQTLWGWIYPGGANYYSSAANFTAAHSPFEAHSNDIVGGSDPFFVNAAAGDFRVRNGSVAYNSGVGLPADVASALGVSAGVTVDKGALDWPGRITLASTTPTPSTPPVIQGDLNGDSKVNVFDLSILLSKWNTSDTSADLNGDGTVNVFDLSILLSKWTP